MSLFSECYYTKLCKNYQYSKIIKVLFPVSLFVQIFGLLAFIQHIINFLALFQHVIYCKKRVLFLDKGQEAENLNKG